MGFCDEISVPLLSAESDIFTQTVAILVKDQIHKTSPKLILLNCLCRIGNELKD